MIATRKQKASYRRRGILLAEQYTRDHYYEIESTTLNSNDPSSPTAPFSGSTTPLRSPPQCQANTSKPLPSDAVANNVLQGPSSLRAKEFASWSVKARSILDRTSKEQSFNLGEGCAPSSSSSWSSSPHTSPSASGSSTPVRIRRRRCPIPEPHQGFFSRALDQRSLASHVSVSRLGMGGTLYPPIHVGLHTGMLIRGSSPLRPSGGPSPPSFTPNSPTQQHANSFSSGSGINNESCHEDDVECWRTSPGSDDKENRRWYRQELGLNLWQTTLGAAALLGTGFGSGMIKKVHNNNVQLHSKELSRENTEIAV
ncbi:hypothetical protein BX616_010835 [Lobosporangium transversale]|nr:hypothetical protein BX616_010835 [Lobosporangium transversale]